MQAEVNINSSVGRQHTLFPKRKKSEIQQQQQQQSIRFEENSIWEQSKTQNQSPKWLFLWQTFPLLWWFLFSKLQLSFLNIDLGIWQFTGVSLACSWAFWMPLSQGEGMPGPPYLHFAITTSGSFGSPVALRQQHLSGQGCGQNTPAMFCIHSNEQ